LTHSRIKDLPDWVPTDAICVPNDVKVRRARLILQRPGGGAGEALLLKSLGGSRFEALVRPGANLTPGKEAKVINPLDGSAAAVLLVESELDEGLRVIRLQGKCPFDWGAVDSIGRVPLPPYIQRQAVSADDERYQTVFHSEDGEAAAAPTAGLHFTQGLIDSLKQKGHLWLPIRLHVGLGTFRPMAAEDIEGHAMHEESYEIPETSAQGLENALRNKTGGILAIGTTSLRALESAWEGASLARGGSTRIFIRPGYKVKTASHLLTNFHLPESTLFVLVAALLGIDAAQHAYKIAIQEKYRFFSYGDAMLIQNIRH
jgi:S-adenosylmethionine:tRNA ribosyltransferase-isomerase